MNNPILNTDSRGEKPGAIPARLHPVSRDRRRLFLGLDIPWASADVELKTIPSDVTCTHGAVSRWNAVHLIITVTHALGACLPQRHQWRSRQLISCGLPISSDYRLRPANEHLGLRFTEIPGPGGAWNPASLALAQALVQGISLLPTTFGSALRDGACTNARNVRNHTKFGYEAISVQS